MHEDLSHLRKEYTRHGLHESELAATPVEQFRTWFTAACEGGVEAPDAMTLATADGDGRPSARIVLLKGYDERGFVFFTNYESRKGRELDANPNAALLFFWSELEQQVRIEGRVERVTAEESDAYFAVRPFGSRIGAVASRQSEPLASREDLEARVRELESRFGPSGEVPRPPHWGGYRLLHERVEFWQGRPSRLHDRLLFTREGDGWPVVRLSP